MAEPFDFNPNHGWEYYKQRVKEHFENAKTSNDTKPTNTNTKRDNKGRFTKKEK